MTYSGKCEYYYTIDGKYLTGEVPCNKNDTIKIPNTDVSVICPSRQSDNFIDGQCTYTDNSRIPIWMIAITIIILILILFLIFRKKK